MQASFCVRCGREVGSIPMFQIIRKQIQIYEKSNNRKQANTKIVWCEPCFIKHVLPAFEQTFKFMIKDY